MVDLSIIIVSWNTRDLLKECLDSIYKYTSNITFEVIVVDNASSDGSVDLVKKMFPQVHVIANDYNAGFTKANNQGIKISNGKYIAILNPDTRLIENVFGPLVEIMKKQNDIGAIGPKILSGDGTSIQYVCARKLPTPYLDLINNLKLDKKFPNLFSGIYMYNWDHNNSRFVELISGACMVIRKKTIEDIGLFDEKQFMYADDLDMCKRILEGRWKIYYHANVSIIHYGGESSKKIKIFTNIAMLESKYYYYQKHHGKNYAIIFCLQTLVVNGGKYLRSKLIRNKKEQYIELTHIYKRSINWSIKKILNIG